MCCNSEIDIPKVSSKYFNEKGRHMIMRPKSIINLNTHGIISLDLVK